MFVYQSLVISGETTEFNLVSIVFHLIMFHYRYW